MIHFSATLKSGDEIIRENVGVRINEIVESRSGLKHWYGSFELSIEEFFELGGIYRLELEDGRAGDILISNVQITSQGNRTDFQGTGPLE
jgi:hypothetical protein